MSEATGSGRQNDIHDLTRSMEDPLITSLEYDSHDLANSSLEQESNQEDHREVRALLQAVVFVEDAIEHRSVFHKVDIKSLRLYRMYHSVYVRWILRITITIILLLAFFEWPSSITNSSDPAKQNSRPNPPCGLTEAIEIACLLILTCDFGFKVKMVGKKQTRKSKWLIAYFFVLVISFMDLIVSLGYGCREKYRIRRLLRPFFILQNSSLMKKTVQSIRHTLPQILSVLFLFGLHLYFFTMFGMILFPHTIQHKEEDFLTDYVEGKKFFKDIGQSIMSLIVLLTTANNPDVMMPAYRDHRLYSIFFITYLSIGLYFFMNMLLAVIYNEFRGSFMRSLQASFFRRRLGIRAAFEVLRGCQLYGTIMELPSNGVSKSAVRKLIENAKFSRKSRYIPIMMEIMANIPGNALTSRQFQEVFDVVFEDSIKKRPAVRVFSNRILCRLQKFIMHAYFQYFGDLMAFLNVFLITVELAQDKNRPDTGSLLVKFNFCFILFYAVEQLLMVFFIGRKRYFSHKHIWFEFLVTALLVIVQVVYLAFYGKQLDGGDRFKIGVESKKHNFLSAWNLLRITNMLIIVRLLRIIPSIKPLSLVAGTLSDLIKNMRPFGGVVVVIYYVFAILGMMIFDGHSPKPPTGHANSTINVSECGSYQQLDYYANNFDDFGAAIVVLWDVMVVNNWHVFLKAFQETTKTRWSQAYFIMWWFISVVICANLLIALVLEAFFTQYNQSRRRKKTRRKFAATEETTQHFRVHQMFISQMQEPTEGELLEEIHQHNYLKPFINNRPLNLLDD